MRIADFVITAAFVSGLAGPAFAQSSSNVIPPATVPANNGPIDDHWFASAYLGPSFGQGGTSAFDNVSNLDINNNNIGINFGGEIGYVFYGGIGAEFMANYEPNFLLEDTLLQRRPNVSNYMFNVIAAIPVDTDHRFRPFVSGGIGAVAMHSTIFTVDPALTNANIATLGTTTASHSSFGWDLGGGVYAFNGPWGLRADLRYFKANTDNNLADGTVQGVFFERELSGLSFWNANFGVAFRW